MKFEVDWIKYVLWFLGAVLIGLPIIFFLTNLSNGKLIISPSLLLMILSGFVTWRLAKDWTEIVAGEFSKESEVKDENT